MPRLAPPQRTSRPFSGLAALAAGAVLAVAALFALGLLAWLSYQEELSNDLERDALLARVVEDHATRTVESAAVAMGYLGRQLDDAAHAEPSRSTEAALTQALATLPGVRSLSLVNGAGQVLASSVPDDVLVQLPLDSLQAWPSDSSCLLAGYFGGRSLKALTQPTPAAQAAVPGSMPLVCGRQRGDGTRSYLVALINPDALSSFQRMTLKEPRGRAYLLSYRGQLLASSDASGPAPGDWLDSHPVFHDYLPHTDHGSYLGHGVLPGRQEVAFRLSHSQPLVVLVEQPLQVTLDGWLARMRWFALAGLIAALLLALMSLALRRSLRARERVNRDLDAARQEVQRREHELSVVLRSVQALIFRTDASGTIVYANDRWTAFHGRSGDAAQARSLAELADPADLPRVAALFASDATSVRQTQLRLKGVDGQARSLEVTVVPLRGRKGMAGFVGSAIDVTARVDAQQALQRQLDFLALVLESNPLPSATVDRDGRYLAVNRAWEQFMARARASVIGRREADFLRPEDAALHARHDAELWRSGGSQRYEALLADGDGMRRDVIVTKVVLRGDDSHDSALLSTLMDVSEYREAERATREARDAAEEASRAKSEFVANISHELRTPLQSILGFSELGVARATDRPRLREMFADIQKSGARMLALVNDLLDVSKIESAIGTINLERAELRGVILPVLRELAPSRDAKQLYFAVDLGTEPLIAKVDSLRFAQVIRNVLVNAIKYSPPGATVDVRAEADDQDQIHFSVRDRGAGIPVAELESIFEAFVQSSGTKDGSGGSGLGLAICRKIITAHGGYIQADNMPDGGAIFRICLPRRHHLDRDTNF